MSNGKPLLIEPLSLEGFLVVIIDNKTNEAVEWAQIRNGLKIQITKAEYDALMKRSEPNA